MTSLCFTTPSFSGCGFIGIDSLSADGGSYLVAVGDGQSDGDSQGDTGPGKGDPTDRDDTSEPSDTQDDSDTGMDSDTNADFDTASDTDVNSDTHTDTDSDIDGDSDTDIDGDADSDTDIDADTDTDVDIDTNVDIDTDIDTDTNMDTETDVDTDTNVETDTGADTETNDLDSGACTPDLPCDDGLFCNGADTCDSTGSCAIHAGSPCASRTYVYAEDFASEWLAGTLLGVSSDWYDGGAGPAVEDNVGCSGDMGLGMANNTVTWTAVPFHWSDPTFEKLNVRLDFQTDENGHFDDDRVGWLIADSSTDSSDIFGLQLDPGGSGYNIEGYWDGVVSTDRRPSFADLPGLSPSTYYRFEVELTKLTATSAQIDFGLYELDGNCDTQTAIVSGSVPDTSALGDDRPHDKYFTAPTLWPGFKNHDGLAGYADNAYARITYTGTSDCYQCDDIRDSCFVPAGTPCADDGLYCNGAELCDGAGTCVGAGNPCDGALVPVSRTENFESGYPPGSTLSAHQDWFDGETFPLVLEEIGCGGGIGLGTAYNVFIWEAVPLYWNYEGQIITVGANVQSDASGGFFDDRMGWTVSSSSTDSSNVFGVEIDDLIVQGYWDGMTQRDIRPRIVDLTGLIQPDTWYHLEAVFTRLTPTSACVDTYLYDLTTACAWPGTLIATGSIPDTSALGLDAPHPKYFVSDTIWPVFKNYDSTDGYLDDLYVQAALATEECTRCDESDDDCIMGAGAVCTDAAPNDCYASQCDGLGNCDQSHAVLPAGVSCEDATPEDCYAAACVAGGACDQTYGPRAAGTPCPDLTPDDCMLAVCDDAATCQQNGAFQPTNHACEDSLYCNGSDRCDGAGSCAAHAGDPCQSYVVVEDFEVGFPSGSTLGDHPEWYDGTDGLGPTVQAGVGCDGTIGLEPSSGSSIWTAHPFAWSDSHLSGVVLEADFEASNQGKFSGDRVGWSVSDESLDSTHTFGVQLDPGADGKPTIEGYWDGALGEASRIPIVSLDGLIGKREWYRLRCEVTRLTTTSARIDVSLWALDTACQLGASALATGSIADTSDLGGDAPQERYFTTPVMWPVYRNANAVHGTMDNLYFAIETVTEATCNESTDSCD